MVHAIAERPSEPSWPSSAHILAVAALIVVVLLFGIFGVTPDGNGIVQPIDNLVSSWLRFSDAHHPSLVLHLLSGPLLPALASVAVALSWRHDARRWRWLVPPVVTAAAGVVTWSIAAIVGRPSPGHLGDLAAVNATTFPSIVAAMTAALAFTVAGASRQLQGRHGFIRKVGISIAAAVVAAAPGLVTAIVWPLDVAAGAALGIAIAGLATRTRLETRRRRRPRRGVRWIAVTSVAVLLVPASFSYAQILAAQGNAPVDARTIEWLRDHGMSAFVDRGESWWLWRHLPSTTAVITELPAAPVHLSRTTTIGTVSPATVRGPIQPPLPREGRWSVAAVDLRGVPELETTFFRPDRSHPSVVVGVAWINSSNTKISLIAGTRQPGGGVGPAGGHVPRSALPGLLAAFNSGYKMKDTGGGALVEGRLTHQMRDGLATLAVLPDGTPRIGAWGTDLDPHGDYTAIRQNLHLMVVNGKPVSGVTTNAGAHWGIVKNVLPTWRSGLGITANGDLVYVAGNQLTLGVLAQALVAAGAVTAMELDIHRGMVTFNLFTHDHGVVGHKLLPDMTTSANRYLTTDWRDFVMVTSR